MLAELVSEQAMRHGEQLAPLIEQALAEAGATRLDLTAIGVGVGPGPFTGLRVGLVTARTLGFVLDVPVYGVCSLDALAVEAVDTRRRRRALRGRDRRAAQGGLPGGVRRRRRPGSQRPGRRQARTPWPPTLPVVGEGALLYPEHFPHPSDRVRASAGWLGRAIVTRSGPSCSTPSRSTCAAPTPRCPGTPKPVS